MNKFVFIPTGSIREAALVQERPNARFVSGKETVFFEKCQLTSKGLPDKRKGSQRVGITRNLNREQSLTGQYVPYDELVEATAAPIRNSIKRLKAELKQAEQDLLVHYASVPVNLNESKSI